MIAFSKAAEFALEWEGGRRVSASGVVSKYGISDLEDVERVLHCSDKLGVIDTLTEADARLIYEETLWKPYRCGEMPAPIGVALFDSLMALPNHRAEVLRWLCFAFQLDSEAGGPFLSGKKLIAAILTDEALKQIRLASPIMLRRFLSRRCYHYMEQVLENPEERAHNYRGWINRVLALVETVRPLPWEVRPANMGETPAPAIEEPEGNQT